MEIFAKEKKYEKYNYTDADAEKVIVELIEQIKQIEVSIFYTLLNYNSEIEIVYLVSTDDFYSSWAQRYIKAIQSLADENTEITAITVFDKLKELKISNESDLTRLIELQTTTATIAGPKTVEILKKYVKQLRAFKKLKELEQKIIENIEYSDEIDTESIVDEYHDFLNQQQSQSELKYISNSEILQYIENQDFELNWLFQDFILAKSINILDGRGGTKKSRFAIQLSVHTVAQIDFLCFPHALKEIGVDYKNVFFISPQTENNPKLIASILHNMCRYLQIDINELLKHLIFIQKSQTLLQKTNKGIEPTDFYSELKRLSKQHKPDLVVIDPLARYMGVELSNENIAILYNYLEELDSTFLLIHHQPKSDIGKNINQTTALGGVLFRELARARFTLQGENLMIEKNNMSRYFNHILKLEYDYENCIFKTKQTEPYEIEFLRIMEQHGHGGNGKGKKNY